MGDNVPNGRGGALLDAKHAAAVGLVSVTFFAVCWVIMASIDGDWAWNENMVSDFGMSDSSIVRNLFAMSCAICGTGMVVCGYCIARDSPGFWMRLTFILCIICGILLWGVGLFDKSYDIHNFCAIVMCIPAALSAVTMSVHDYLERRYVLIGISAAMGLLCGYLMLFVPEYAQSVSIMCLLSWYFIRDLVIVTS